jgi:hydrophobic/amphiphilic exporter-1 (mainly G- bacteria), HAE1 family
VQLTRFALHNPIAITLFYVLIAILGIVALTRMGRSILPPVSFPVVAIAASYPGAGPREMERLVVEPIEDQLNSIPNLDRVSVSAQDGNTSLLVRFRFGSDLDTDRSNVQQAVDAARPNMPFDLSPPVVQNSDPSQVPILEEAVTSAVLSPRALAELVEDRVAPALRAVPGVGEVRTSGESTRQLTVVPESASLAAVGATSLDVLRALTSANDIFPGGRFRARLSEATVGVRSSAESADALMALPVAIPAAATIRVADVARTVDGYADDSVISRVDQTRAIVVYISRAEGEDSIRTISNASAAFARLAKRYPLIRFERLRSDAPYTTAAIDGVVQTLGEGIVLTVLVMLFFLHAWRSAIISAIAIPASLFAAFTAMWIAGFTINVLSLMALSLTIGILVDDSIVIVEAIARAAERGLQRDSAALAGRGELGAAAVAITLVDVAVFAPMAFMSGVVGEFMREFGAVIVVATAFSLLVSFTLTPLLAARWALRSPPPARVLPWMLRTPFIKRLTGTWNAGVGAARAFEDRVGRSYVERWLPQAWTRRNFVLAATVAACAGSLVLLFSGRISSEFSPSVSRGVATMDLTFPAGTPLVQTDRRAMRVADKLLEEDDVAHTVVTAGREFNGTTDVFASNVAQIDAMLADTNASGDAVVEKVKAMQGLVADARISQSGKGMGGIAPISYSVAGEPGVIDAAAARIARALSENPNATDVRVSDAGIGPRLDITIDPARAVLLGVTSDDAAQVARIATGGTIAAKVRTTSGLVNVYLRSDAAENGDLDAILRSTVRSNANVLVPLADLATITRGSEPAVIERENGERVVSVTANSVASAPIGLVTGPMAVQLRDPNFLPPGARVEPRGDIEQLLQTVSEILATLAFSVGIVYGILAILYRSYSLPLVIMATVPLAAIGAIGALFVMKQPLNLYSMLGIVMLVGIVAKNGILLVEYAERQVRAGAGAFAAMRDAARLRFRPILMTTLAMIAGMLPLALGDTVGAEYRQALGVVVIGGLSSSLVLTLVVVPLVYIGYRGENAKKAASKPPSWCRPELPVG